MLTTLEKLEVAQAELLVMKRKAHDYLQSFENSRDAEQILRAAAKGLEVAGEERTRPWHDAQRDAQARKNAAVKYKVLYDSAMSDVCSLEMTIRELRRQAEEERLQAKNEANARIKKLADRQASYRDEAVKPLAMLLAATAAKEGLPLEAYSLSSVVTSPLLDMTADVKAEAHNVFNNAYLGEV
jgi:hypothetical protein